MFQTPQKHVLTLYFEIFICNNFLLHTYYICRPFLLKFKEYSEDVREAKEVHPEYGVINNEWKSSNPNGDLRHG